MAGGRLPGIFSVDVLLISRRVVANSANPPLYAALLGAVHFLIFVLLVRLYSAVTDRDAMFLAMLAFAGILAAAVLTVDTTFLFCFFACLIFAVATFRAWSCVARGGRADSHGRRGRTSTGANAYARADSRVAQRGLGAIIIGGTLFFFFPRSARDIRPHKY